MIPDTSNYDDLWFIALLMCVITTGVLEMRWSGFGINNLWTCTCGFQAAEIVFLGYLVSASRAYLKTVEQ
jgi:hypothetical protein